MAVEVKTNLAEMRAKRGLGAAQLASAVKRSMLSSPARMCRTPLSA